MAGIAEGTNPIAVVDDNPMSVRQWIVVALMVLLNALDGFDVLSSAFAAPGITKEWGIARPRWDRAVGRADRHGLRLGDPRQRGRQGRAQAGDARLPRDHGDRHVHGPCRYGRGQPDDLALHHRPRASAGCSRRPTR
jgi:hypothetical protein